MTIKNTSTHDNEPLDEQPHKGQLHSATDEQQFDQLIYTNTSLIRKNSSLKLALEEHRRSLESLVLSNEQLQHGQTQTRLDLQRERQNNQRLKKQIAQLRKSVSEIHVTQQLNMTHRSQETNDSHWNQSQDPATATSFSQFVFRTLRQQTLRLLGKPI
ncbi:MAG: hypothetical protein COA42_08090 [Alteromonadaceae bacterium]|nr:MAG: hypothetical protein COA42_08090 [Alteromonadaceae bacterium]